jgi:NAD(P)-dependent dehydrogenase (short-subunit alcohol dehydrogenase family)
MKSLTGKRILITGAAGGIGSAIVRKLVQAGSTLLLVDLDTPCCDGCHQKPGRWPCLLT